MLNKRYELIKNNKLISSIILSIVLLLLSMLLTKLTIINKTFGTLFTNLFSVIICILGIIWFIREVKKDSKTYLMIFIIFLMIVFLCYSFGYIAMSMANTFFPNLKTEMFGFYGNLISAIISSIVGVFGAVIGAKVGGDKAYKASIDSVKMTIENDNKKTEEEKENREKLIIKMITSFIMPEITHNYKIIMVNNSNLVKNLTDYNEPTFTYNFKYDQLQFNEFYSIREELLRQSFQQALDIIETYTMFKILNESEGFELLDKEQYKFVKEIILKKYKVANK